MARGSAERSFGLSVGTVCGLLAGLSLWRGRLAAAQVLGMVALALIMPALTRPSLLRLPSRLWWRMAHVLGWVNARLLLSLFFGVILTPVAVMLRCTRRDPLRIRKPSRGSGWVPFPEGHRDPKHYERMY